jgi:hypothetical protein
MRFARLIAGPMLLFGLMSVPLEATTQFARKYRKDCSFCHLAPPLLNATGEAFLARGYRMPNEMAPMASHKTAPVAIWSTADYERRAATNKAFASRVEIISAGPIGRTRAAYFAEWRLLSQQIASGNTLTNRSGRFEDLFVTTPVGGTRLSVTVGQFRATSQVDVSRRLSISEPQVFSAGLPGQTASTPRVTGLRAFAPSGRQPAMRVMWQQAIADRPSDGWYAGATVVFPGELTIPFTDAASFEVEGTPKGVVLELYRRSGISSFGGNAFVGDDRQLAMAVGAFNVGPRVVVTAAAGVSTVGVATDSRYSLQGELFFHRLLSAAARLEDRTGVGRRAAGVLTLNAHVPFGPDWFRQAMRLQVEQRISANDHRTLVALSHVF